MLLIRPYPEHDAVGLAGLVTAPDHAKTGSRFRQVLG